MTNALRDAGIACPNHIQLSVKCSQLVDVVDKGDTLAYEAIAAALADSRNARTRVSGLLHAIAAASANEVTARFVVEPGAAGPVTAWVFAPWG